MAAYGPLCAAHNQLPYQGVADCELQPRNVYQDYQQQQLQCQQGSERSMACEESWPWDDNLLDSPGSDSFESASTNYDPPSDNSIPDSYTSSTASTSALIHAHCPAPTNSHPHSSTESGVPAHLPHHFGRGCAPVAVSKPPLVPVPCQLVQASEHRRYAHFHSSTNC